MPTERPVTPELGQLRSEIERDALMQVAAAAAGATGLDELLELTSDAGCQAIDAGSFSISKWERGRNVMRTLVNAGTLGPGEERLPEDETYSIEDHPTVDRLVRTATPYHYAVDDPDADPRAVALLNRLQKESGMGVPIVVDDRVWGDVWATTTIGAPRFRGRDLRFLEAIAGQLAGVIARGERFSRVSRLAYEDELTGLANRRALDEQLGAAADRWRGQATPLTLLVCDVDELKTINDDRGHHAGDRALRRVSRSLLKAAAPYPGSCVARISGDEFAVVLIGVGLEAASDVAATALRVLDAERDMRVAVSCGAASAGPGVEHPEQLMRAADAAQYAAKRRGGGQLCTAGSAAYRASLAAGDGERAPPRGRRGRRRSTAERLEATSTRVLALLDRNLATHPTVDRLEAVAAGLAEVVNAAAWTISFAAHGERTIHSLASADDRDSRLRGIRVGLEREVYALADFPLTERVVHAGSGSYVVDAHDRSAEAAERKLLHDLGYSAVLGTAVSDVEGTYLVELFADGDTSDLGAADLSVSLLARAAAAHSNTTVESVRRLRKRTRHLALLGALSSRLGSADSELEAVEATVEELHNEFGHPLTSISRVNAGQVDPVVARGELAAYLFESAWHQSVNVGLIGRCLREHTVVAVGDVMAEPDYRPLGEARGVRSEMCAPLMCGDHIWGVIDIEDTRPDAFDADDAHLLRSLADLVGSVLRSTNRQRRVEGAYLDTVEAIAAALEAKDSYSASHSHSIGAHAEAVGRDLGLDDAALRDLRLGVAFHDIGKLAISEAILGKPEPLTAYERSLIEQHTVLGERILAPIELLARVRPIVRHCHERWDGNGYPDRLAGSQIPLAARIVFACDAFDAMTTDRPYRAALSREDALAELERCAGTQFDPAVAHSLLRLLRAADPYGVVGSA